MQSPQARLGFWDQTRCQDATIYLEKQTRQQDDNQECDGQSYNERNMGLKQTEIHLIANHKYNKFKNG